jgi:hypothetical protein
MSRFSLSREAIFPAIHSTRRAGGGSREQINRQYPFCLNLQERKQQQPLSTTTPLLYFKITNKK